MDVADFDYRLPPEAIAQTPVEPRHAARLLVDDARVATSRTVADLPDLLEAGDLLVVNDTRVLPARLRLAKATGGAVEVLLLEPRADGMWEALVQPSRRVAPGTVLSVPGGGEPVLEVGGHVGARRWVRLLDEDADEDEAEDEGDGLPGGGLPASVAALGEVPLPPYIHAALDDPERYQTVFARRPGSVAAPTAGLHLTDEVLDRCRTRGVAVARIELRVGIATFAPMTVEQVEDHPLHSERFRVEPEVVAAAARARRVVAVGTTTVRALETAAATGAAEGRTSLFIHGDHRWRVVDRLLTNLHMPRSSLLVLVEAFVGPRWRELYELALADGYRFGSFGDAMLLTRRGTTP